jgi:hypothetical protein
MAATRAASVGNKKTYKALARRDGRWWAVEIQGLPPNYLGVTRGRTWAEAEEMTRDAIAMLLDIPANSFDVELLPGDEEARSALAALESARQAAAEAQRAQEEALHQAARTLTQKGFSVRDAGAAMHISYQRVSQLAPRRNAA